MTLVLDDGDVELWHADAFAWLPKQTTQRFDSIVTSPPYCDQRDYGGATPDHYVVWVGPFLIEALRLLTPTGSMMLNLGTVLRDGEEHPYIDDTVTLARRLGWKLLQRMIWHKPNIYPPSHLTYLTQQHEYVLWLAPSVNAYRGYDHDTRAMPLSMFGPNLSRRPKLNPEGTRPGTVVSFAVGTNREIKHTAAMPLGLARHLVSLCTPPEGLVLDPFVGAGTTALAARQRGRRCVGVDHDPQALAEATERLAQQSLLGGVV